MTQLELLESAGPAPVGVPDSVTVWRWYRERTTKVAVYVEGAVWRQYVEGTDQSGERFRWPWASFLTTHDRAPDMDGVPQVKRKRGRR